MKYKNYYQQCIMPIAHMTNLPLLFIRLVLAYGFYGPATMKWQNIQSVAGMFAETGIPIPLFSTYLVATTEMLGAILLLVGLCTRFITVPLMIVMIVAITTVHWTHGFAAGNNGFEIPLYYLIMLFTIFVYGSGKFSLDYFFGNKFRESSSN